MIFLTLESAKELACQSIESRWRPIGASRATSDVVLSVNGTTACRPVKRRITETKPSATMTPMRRAPHVAPPHVRAYANASVN